jgi:hypothetical protein
MTISKWNVLNFLGIYPYSSHSQYPNIFLRTLSFHDLRLPVVFNFMNKSLGLETAIRYTMDESYLLVRLAYSSPLQFELEAVKGRSSIVSALEFANQSIGVTSVSVGLN